MKREIFGLGTQHGREAVETCCRCRQLIHAQRIPFPQGDCKIRSVTLKIGECGNEAALRKLS